MDKKLKQVGKKQPPLPLQRKGGTAKSLAKINKKYGNILKKLAK